MESLRNAEDVLLVAVDTIVNCLDKGDTVCVAFLDLRKAFDSLDHCILLCRPAFWFGCITCCTALV